MTTAPRQLFLVDDPRCDAHVAQGPHPECPERLRAIRSGLLAPLRQAGAHVLVAREAEVAELTRVHAPEHIALLEQTLRQERVGYLDADTFFSQGTRQATWLAAGGAAELAAALIAHDSAAGVLAVRPPGHHATRTRAMGFCLVNNIAVAAAAALAQGLERVAIVDWDVHHGNGTQAIFEDEPRVLMISLHQWPLYPGTGRSDEIGTAAGRGYTVNLPLPAASAAPDYAAAFREVVQPLLVQYAPQLVLVSAGFDAHVDDPLAGMCLRDEDFGALTGELWKAIQGAGCSRLGLVLEGGYDLGALERSGDAVAGALLGTAYAFDEKAPTRAARQAIDATRRALSPHWSL